MAVDNARAAACQALAVLSRELTDREVKGAFDTAIQDGLVSPAPWVCAIFENSIFNCFWAKTELRFGFGARSLPLVAMSSPSAATLRPRKKARRCVP